MEEEESDPTSAEDEAAAPRTAEGLEEEEGTGGEREGCASSIASFSSAGAAAGASDWLDMESFIVFSISCSTC